MSGGGHRMPPIGAPPTSQRRRNTAIAPIRPIMVRPILRTVRYRHNCAAGAEDPMGFEQMEGNGQPLPFHFHGTEHPLRSVVGHFREKGNRES
jgi:hypothetical protein